MHASGNTSVKTKNKWFLIGAPILIIFMGLLGLIVMSSMAQQPEKKAAENLATLVDVMDIQASDVTFNIATQGTVVPRTETINISEVSGMILQTSEKFKVGGFFKKGEVLLEIDPITYEVALIESQSQLESKQAQLIEEQAKAQQAEEEWGLTGRTLEQAPILALRLPQLKKAEAEVKAAEADVKEAEIKLSHTKIIAPYDALITEKFADIGQYVSTNSQLSKIIAVDYAEVRLPIKQKDVAYIDLPKINEFDNKSHLVTVSAKAGADTISWDSFITRYEGVVSNTSRVHYLVAQIDDPYNLFNQEHDDELRIGMFVTAKVKGKTFKSIIKLPRTALYGSNVINTITADNKLNIVTVEVIRTDSKYVYIKNTVGEGERLVLTKMSTSVQGMSLRVKGENSDEQYISPPLSADALTQTEAN